MDKLLEHMSAFELNFKYLFGYSESQEKQEESEHCTHPNAEPDNASELNESVTSTLSPEYKISFAKVREQLEHKPKPYRHSLNEEEKKLIAERTALASPIAKLNFRYKLTQSLSKNPNTEQLFDINKKYKFPSLFVLALSKVRTMKLKGELSDDSLSVLPNELIEQVNFKI